ncbi:MAG TPA: hypothetical protein VFV38_28865 [Ktedonobacteraceae bacterium]|nr:hypothetical protein [Ktedonobacteraceae bacterium]
MTAAVAQRLHLLYCYAPEDQQWAERIDAQLQDLKRQHQIISRFDGELVSTLEQRARLLALFEDMDFVLLLVSSHFQAVESFWKELYMMSRLSLWPSLEQAFEQLWLAKGDIHRDMGGSRMAHEALAAYEEALRLNPLLHHAWDGKAIILLELRRFEEALEKWQRHRPALIALRTSKPPVLIGPKLYEEALLAIEEELRLDPTYLWAWDTKAHALVGLKRYEEALEAIDVFLQGKRADADAWHEKGEIPKALGRKREARQAQQQARQLGWPG